MLLNLRKNEENRNFKDVIASMKAVEELQFWIGNPSVDLIAGTLHLHPYQPLQGQQGKQIEVRSSILAAVSIPNFKNVTELYSFFKDFHNYIQIMRVLKTANIDYYCVIIKLDSDESASKFYNKYNGKKYNQIEEDIFLLREVKEVSIKTDRAEIKLEKMDSLIEKKDKSDEASFVSSNTSDIFYLTLEKNVSRIKKQKSTTKSDENHFYCPICFEQIFSEEEKYSPLLKKNMSVESEGSTTSTPVKMKAQELDLSEASPIIGILCGHFFHISCLEKWNDTSCPVCRYYQHPVEHSKCDICGSDDDLWMCIICGFIGCAPEGPSNGHIKEHYEANKHIYALEVETKTVYDFAKGGFVHRLLQNAMDGKIVQYEAEGNNPNQNRKDFEYGEMGKKIDTISYEYNLLLSSQYQSQKNYYQDILTNLNKDHEHIIREQEEELEYLTKDTALLREECAHAEKSYFEKKNEFLQLKELFTKLNAEKNELEKENKNLSKHQQGIDEEEKTSKTHKQDVLKGLKEEVQSLLLQIKDIESHLAAKEKIQKALGKEGVDSNSAHIIVSGGPTKSRKGKKK